MTSDIERIELAIRRAAATVPAHASVAEGFVALANELAKIKDPRVEAQKVRDEWDRRVGYKLNWVP